MNVCPQFDYEHRVEIAQQRRLISFICFLHIKQIACLWGKDKSTHLGKHQALYLIDFMFCLQIDLL